MVNQVRLLDSAHKLALANVDKAMLSLPANVERTIEEARNRIERAKADKALFGGALLAQEQIEGVEQMLKVYAIIGAEHPKNNVTFAGGTREKLAVLNAEVDKLAAELIAANEPPADNYRGGDAAALKEMLRKVWATNYPTVKIVRIGLRGDWNRAGGYKWEGNQESWLKFDASRLAGWMVIDTGHNKFVYLRSANLYRDHTNGDRTEARVQMYDPKEKVHPGQTYLKTKL